MPRHQFTREERSKGGKVRAAQPSFSEHCENAYEMLKWKRPDAALYILRQKIAPYMQAKKGDKTNGK